MQSFFRAICFLAIALGIGGLGAASERIEKLQQEIPKLMKAAGIPGLSIGLIEQGELRWIGPFGVRDAHTGDAVDEGTVFEAASLSKPVVAAALMQLVARDGFDLDRPLADILEYPRLSHDPRYRQITARMVLGHTTGLPNWGGTPLRLSRDPGSRWGYSGEGFVYLQKTLEKLLDMRLDDFVRREVFQPLGMTRSSFVWRDSYQSSAASGHDELGRHQPMRQRDSANAAASLMTTAADYARFLAALLTDDGLAPGTLRRMKEFQTAVAGWGDPETHKSIGWGLGWGIQTGDRGRALWHWGDNGNFRCFVIFYPESQDGLVYFTNSMNGLSIARALLQTAFADNHSLFRFLDYDAHDDPKRTARIALRKAFLEKGLESGRTMLSVLLEATPSIANSSFMSSLGEFLLDEGQTEEGLYVLQTNVSAYPEIEKAQQDYGAGLFRADQLQKAIGVYERYPDSKDALRRLRWVEELQAAKSRPIEISTEEIALLAGKYGPRHVRLRQGNLFYERDGSGREYRLYPLGPRLFRLEGLNTFRLEFIAGPDGKITKVVGHYFDGSSDENPRDPD